MTKVVIPVLFNTGAGAGGTPLVITLSTSPLKGTMCAPRRRLVIELDGSQHLEQIEYDLRRTEYFESRGYRVLRFWNNEVLKNIDGVLNGIWNELKQISTPSPRSRYSLP